ncbi:FAD-binding oxidoreductase [Chloroflexus aggregans]|jgi:glycolate oxidase|uniref:D-lactate dehydrogenase (Cytochrome) n=1 Tax=Chloroflexus aggregans (strain MD-66 / DSM 9485) TaxID=326427 RepID=B8GBG0_CHLAD|nr:FAD-linked oxidase C-terminal domain-containing protein [Chloroflexus aggregans]ACL24788.1 D-lactate dehydrogenase (cytochrome) [Chloroflexus aggregans DSM 9485]
MRDELIAALLAVVDPTIVLRRPEELLLYEYDGSALDQGMPEVVVVPRTTAEVAACVRVAAQFGVPIVARGAGTGLAGGSVPEQGGLVISLARLNRILTIDPISRTARVQSGVVNSDLSLAANAYGLHFAPDPSSQRASTIGGNIATNAGGPHCLKYGVTTNHVLATTVVLGDGRIVEFGSAALDMPGYDLLGVIVGSEGTLGIVTEALVKLTPNPEAVQTFLAIYDDLDAASTTVSAIIAHGIIPAALEMLVGQGIAAVEAAVQAGYPADARAVLLIEIDGLSEEIAAQAHQIEVLCHQHGVRELRAARDEAQRAKLWAGRKGALAACARIAPHYHIQDGVVPRSRLPELLRLTEAVAQRHQITIVNIFHAGDGNLHPLLLFDVRHPGALERAIAASEEILQACVAAGGTISGEHGIGIEKRNYLGWIFGPADLSAFADVRAVFDPNGFMNPCKLLPSGSSCADIRYARGALRALDRGAWI